MNLQSISDTLQDQLRSGKCNDLISLKKWLDTIDVEGWKEMVNYQEEKYCRNVFTNSTLFDLVVICWKPGQGSPVHDHPEKGCLVKILHGTLGDELTSADGSVKRNKYQEGDVLYINNDMGMHRVFNQSDQGAVSLHIYAPGEYTPH